MTFIKKQKIEEQAIVEEVQTEEKHEENLQSVVLKVVSEQLEYVAKMNKAIDAASEAGKDDLVSVLKDSRAAMKKSIAELYRKSKDIIGFEDFGNEEKESVTEAIDNSKVYEGNKVADIFSDFTVDLLGTDAADDLETIARYFDSDTDYTAEQIDSVIDGFQIDPAMREAIESEISALPDARQSRMQEFKSDLDSDITILESLADEDKLLTFAAKTRLLDLISGLKRIEYDGRPGVVWGKNDYGQNKGTIIA